MSQIHKICYDKVLPRDLLAGRSRRHLFTLARDGRVRAIMPIDKQWPNGTTLRARFLGGDSTMHDMVKQFAPEWSLHGNVKFDFNSASDAEIRISFLDDGAWSYVGTDCLDIPQHAATMNFAWLDDGVVLHEFGHAIGLAHEHQNPMGGIQWNEQEVIRSLSGPPNYWDEATIRHNVIEKYTIDQIRGTQFDSESIMLYSFPASWTLNGSSTSANETLSALDKAFVGSSQGYPFVATQGLVELRVTEVVATEASIGKPGEEALFRFTAENAARYVIETQGPTDVVLKLFGPNSLTKLVAEDDDSGTAYNARIIADISPGTYIIQVRQSNSASGTGSYSIKVSK